MWRGGLSIMGILGRLGWVQCNLRKRKQGAETRMSTIGRCEPVCRPVY